MSRLAPTAGSAVVPGSKLFEVSAVDDRWETVSNDELAAGRYIIQVTGTTRASGPSSYSGQLSFVSVPIPSSMALVLLGLLGVGGMSVRRQKH